MQALSDDKVLGHDNNFVIGASVDRSKIGFRANSELGFIYPDLFVGPNAAVPGTGEIIHTAGNLGFSPVSLAAWQTYYGAYFNETFDLTNRLSLTAGGRYNLAAIDMADLLGTSPDLNSSLTYARFNPVTGFTYKILPELMTFYAGYSEANRIPTPLELGCSNPQKPCLLEGFLVSDPAAATGGCENRTRPDSVETSTPAAVAATGSSGCSTPTARTTSFRSQARFKAAACSRTFPLTRRQGLEAGAQYQTGQYLVYANYAFIDATYQFSGELASPNNPFADANGNIFVTPGNQIPGIPRHQVKGGVDYWFTPELKLGTDVIWVSSQWFIGDDANQNPKLADYWVANLHGSYQLTKECADLRLHQQSVQSQIRDLRHFLRYAIDGRGRDTERAERPPHGHAGAAALGLCGDARKAVRPVGR